ncbi:MAG: hypothetical protein SGJ18_13115 [Pseudomonadota bacterium]|nr:hypothetical protein [Pseudomonadota bacterium]
MKLISIIFSVFILSIISRVSSADNVLYNCQGYSSEGLENPDITLSISEHDKQFSLNLKFGESNTSSIRIFRKKLGVGEISFYDTFINKKETIKVNVFMDDMGSTSSLLYKGSSFDLTCG